MLTIILNILSFLGILLLVILGLLLLIILVVLFVPIFYRIKVDKNANLHVSARASWLLGLVRVCFLYPDPGTVTLKVLFFKIFDSGSEKTDSRTTDGNTKRNKKRRKSRKSEPAGQEKETKRSQREYAKDSTEEEGGQAEGRHDTQRQNTTQQSAARQTGSSQDKTQQSTAGQTASSGGEGSKRDTDEQRDDNKQNPFEKLQYTIRDICDKIKNIRDNIDHYKEILLCEDTKGLLNHGFIRLGKILKSIRPRKLKADIRFGTGSPDATGYAYAVYGILCPYLGRNVFVVPDFEQAVLEGEIEAAGHITGVQLLWNGLMLVLDKRLKKLIAKLKQED